LRRHLRRQTKRLGLSTLLFEALLLRGGFGGGARVCVDACCRGLIRPSLRFGSSSRRIGTQTLCCRRRLYVSFHPRLVVATLRRR
jgi:hypothetical protein